MKYFIAFLLCMVSTMAFADINKLRREAISGNPDAQFQYGIYLYARLDSIDIGEAHDWLNSAASNGHERAAAYLALLSAAKQDFKSANAFLSTVTDSCAIVDNLTSVYASVRAIKTIINFLKSNSQFSIIEYGPLGNDIPFLFERNDTVYVCASLKGKSGLLKLDNRGLRIGHDDIPLSYDYIVPMYGEQINLRSAVGAADSYIGFIVSPYLYRIPITDSDMRRLDIHGNETYFSIYGSERERVRIPEQFVYDSVRGSYIESDAEHNMERLSW